MPAKSTLLALGLALSLVAAPYSPAQASDDCQAAVYETLALHDASHSIELNVFDISSTESIRVMRATSFDLSRMDSELLEALKMADQRYRETGAATSVLEQLQNTHLDNTIWIILREKQPDGTVKLKGLTAVFDGTQETSRGIRIPMPIEMKFPELKIDERAAGPKFEIGRLASFSEEKGITGKLVKGILFFIANKYGGVTRIPYKTRIYAWTNREYLADYYQRFGLNNIYINSETENRRWLMEGQLPKMLLKILRGRILGQKKPRQQPL